MTFLPDVNVWLALFSQVHIHAPVCAGWFNSVGPAEVEFCRVTQMGLLRLLTNSTVMGTQALTPRGAWRAYQRMLGDERVQFAHEPSALEREWQQITMTDRPAHKFWTDAYLVAFARASDMRLVTLDRGLRSTAPDALFLQ